METLETEVAIIGGGIAGVCAAYHVAQRDRKVIVLEKDFAGSKASGVNFGGTRTNGRAEGEIPLSLRAKKIWNNFEKFSGSWCDYKPGGHLEVSHEAPGLDFMEKWSAMAKGYGVKSSLLTPAQIRKKFPYISDKMIGGCLVEDDGSANPRLVMPTLVKAARKLGADIRERSPVTEVEHGENGFIIYTSSGLKIKAQKLINAAGGWGGKIAEIFGDIFPAEALASQMMISEPIGVKIDHVLDFCLNGRFLYFRQVERGNILFGRGSGDVDLEKGRAYFLPQNCFDGSAVASSFIPDLKGINILRCWGGIDGFLPDSSPVLGFSENVPNLIHGFGFSGHGFQLGPASGAVLAELALDGKTETPIDAFSAKRFKEQQDKSQD